MRGKKYHINLACLENLLIFYRYFANNKDERIKSKGRKEDDTMTNEELVEAIVIILRKCKSNRALHTILLFAVKNAL